MGIIGLGLMGGSLARALRRLPESPRILGADRDQGALDQALAEGIIDAADAPGVVAAAADLVVLAAPIGATLALMPLLPGSLTAGAVATDLCSVKRPVVAAARGLGLADRFVGSHPVAGDHRGGYAASRAELYDGATVWITPIEAGDAADRVTELWTRLGARPEWTDPERHDRLMAWVSHLPQVVASALGGALGASAVRRTALGPGGRDTTRLAASPPALWTEILLSNADLLHAPLSELLGRLQAFAAALRAGDRAAVEQLLADAADWTEKS